MMLNQTISLPVKTSGLGTGALPRDVIQLQEEVGKALGCLLVTRSFLNAHHRKQVSEFKISLCQNESETTEAIKQAKTLCTCTTREAEASLVMLINEAEAQYATCIKEDKANCVSIIAEVENPCSTAIRKAESHGAKQAWSIKQSHAKGMQCLEMESIGEEGKDHLSFLTACGAALWASHPKDCGVLVTPFHLLLGNTPLSTLLNIPPSIFHSKQICPTSFSSFCPHGTWALSPIQMATPLPQPDCIPSSIGSHPTHREGMRCLFTEH